MIGLLGKAEEVRRSEGALTMAQRGVNYLAWRGSPVLWPLFNRGRAIRHRLRYDAPPNVYEPLFVSPSEITRFTWGVSKTLGLGAVRGGDWERDSLPLSEKWVCQGLKQRFVDELDWDETEYVEYPRRKYFAKGEAIWGYDSEAEFVEHRCSYVDDLYESIRQDGYVRSENGMSEFPGMDIRRLGYHHNFDPLVCIGADGTIYHRDGYHRLMIAKALDLDAIPVLVLARHPEWQAVRERAYAGEMADIDTDRSHPDIEPLLG
ncbi:hypothetical protein [Halorubrum halophilum]|uniref:hypothetical protein n=1 Tax=Halorubrum halophilum TaxID=413816 RepID=UPI000678B75C|nr:hypothetical protein [Halorubrum halophilum]